MRVLVRILFAAPIVAIFLAAFVLTYAFEWAGDVTRTRPQPEKLP